MKRRPEESTREGRKAQMIVMQQAFQSGRGP